jgi:hypothetical protein
MVIILVSLSLLMNILIIGNAFSIEDISCSKNSHLFSYSFSQRSDSETVSCANESAINSNLCSVVYLEK